MKERPILFSAPMIRALLDGTKTQTRRVVKLPKYATEENARAVTFEQYCDRFRNVPDDALPYLRGEPWSGEALVCNHRFDGVSDGVHVAKCPYGTIGDRLWVRETWTADVGDKVAGSEDAWWHEVPKSLRTSKSAAWIWYRADDSRYHGPGSLMADDPEYALDESCRSEWEPHEEDRDGLRWQPSIFMPRWASRLTLTITEVRVERLNQISEADCWAEGIKHACPECGTVTDRYRALWNSINGAGSWDANPWVWAISFEVVR